MLRQMLFLMRKSSVKRSCKKKGNLKNTTSDLVVPSPLEFSTMTLVPFDEITSFGIYVIFPFMTHYNLAILSSINAIFYAIGRFMYAYLLS